MIEKTVALCKPDAFELKVVGRILSRIEEEEGFVFVAMKQVTLFRDGAEQFYAEHVGKPFFESLVAFMSSGPILAMVLEHEDAVAHWRRVMGPADARKAPLETLRGLYGDATGQAIWRNVVHGSDSPEAARRRARVGC